MLKRMIFSILTVLSAAALNAGQPTLRKISASQWEIEFTLSKLTDVAVSIVNIKDSTVVRHLAAGVLGPKAPAPLVQDSLHQVIGWDGKDNFGNAVTVPDADLAARIRAGIKVELNAIVGDNPYAFYSGSPISGIVTGKDGSIFICGMPDMVHNEHYTETMGDYKVVRRFDRDGNYVSTVFPFPSNLPEADVQGWGIVSKSDGSYSPFFKFTTIPAISKTMLAPHAVGGRLLGVDGTGRLIFGRMNRSLWLFDSVFTFEPDGRLPLLQNSYYGKRWAEAADASGRVYVCDTANQRIAVYDAGNTLLGGIALPRADIVAVSKKSGNVYALGRVISGATVTLWLFKFAPWDIGGAKICSVNTGATFGAAASGLYGPVPIRGSLAVNDSNPSPWIWVGGGSTVTVLAYQDDGAALTLKKNFFQESQNRPNAINRVAVDRRNETVYLSDNTLPGTIYKIENWGSPKVVRCSTSAGAAMTGWDVAVSPDNRLFVAQNRTGGDWGPYIRRYTLDHRHAPVNYANAAANPAEFYRNSFIRRGGSAANGFSDYRGIDFGYDGRVALISSGLLCGIPASAVYANGAKIYNAAVYSGDTAITDTANHGKIQAGPIWFGLGDPGGAKRGSCGGVQFDLKGNLYVGSLTRATEQPIPAAFASNKAYTQSVGSVIRYGRNDSGSVINSINSLSAGVAAPGAAKIYSSAGVGPFSCDPGTASACICGSPRFDVDPYGRLFLPNAVANQVSIVDNNDNLMLQFGQYGNPDSRGGLTGPGVAIATPGIPLGFPNSVAVSEDYIYITDMANGRLVRVKMTYESDNLPGLTDRRLAEESVQLMNGSGLILISSPVPFTGSAAVRLTLPARSRVVLDVVNVQGKVVRRLADADYSRGLHRFTWNGTDAGNRALAAGLYLYRLQAANRVLVSRTMLVR